MRSFEWIQTAPGSMTSAALGRWGFTLACNLYTSCSCVQFCLRTYVDAFGFSTGGHRRIAAHYACSLHQLRFLLQSELSFLEPCGRGAACDARSPAKTST